MNFKPKFYLQAPLRKNNNKYNDDDDNNNNNNNNNNNDKNNNIKFLTLVNVFSHHA